MAKAKKMLSAVLAALMVVLSVASYVPAQAAKAVNVPKLQMVTQPEKEYKNGDRVSLTVTSPNYGGQVEYRVILWNGTTKKQSELWPTHKGYYYQNWKPAGSYKFTIHWPVEGMEPGAYSLTVLTRRANSKVAYDSFVKTEAFWVKNELAVDSIAALEDVTVDEGAEAKLPAEVTLNMTDKTTKTAKVTWEAVDTAKPGEYTVNGTVEGTDKKATVKVIVKEVALKVESVSAITAKSFKVVFNKVVTDTAKITFDVKRGAVAVSTTNTWSENKKEVVLESSVKFVEGDYTITVNNDKEELAKKDIKITKEKIAKIEIVGDMIVRTSDSEGYITYKVLNQYDEDITRTALGRNIKFASIATVSTKQNGKLHVSYDINPTATPDANRNPMLQLRGLKEVSITAYDVESSITITKTVKVSELLGSISEITFKGIKNKDNKDLEYGDRANKFYIDYEIKDAAGNSVTDYKIISAGIQQIISANPGVATARIAEENEEAVFIVEPAMVPQTVHFDGTSVISLVTKNGKMASVTVTVKRPAQLDSITLMPPTTEVANGEKAEIPFAAFDQNGKEVKEYNKLVAGLSPLSDLELLEQADGTAKIVTKNALTKGIWTFTATTKTGKTSMVTLTVRDAIKVESFAIDESVVYPFMVPGAVQSMDFGYNAGGFALKDQYGRDIDLTLNNMIKDENGKPWYYYIEATTVAGTSVQLDTTKSYFGNTIDMSADGATYGTTAIKFQVMKSINADLSGAVKVDDMYRTMNLTVVEPEDVVDFGMTEISSPFYASGNANAREKEYKQYSFVYGKLANGGEVAIPSSYVKSVYSSNDKFTTGAPGATLTVYAAKLPITVAEAAGKVGITVVNPSNNKVYTAAIDVTSKNEILYTKSIGFSAESISPDDYITPTGITVDGDTVKVNITNHPSVLGNIFGKSFFRYDKDNANTNRSYVYFWVKDQFNKKGMAPSYISVVSAKTAIGGNFISDVTVTNDGSAIVSNGSHTIAAGDTIILTAVSNNGLKKTIKIIFE